VNKQNNWDKHYKNLFRSIASFCGLKGNVVLNGIICQYVVEYCKNHGSYLEIGAGSGRLAKKLSKNFKSCTVLDKSKYALRLAQKVCNGCRFINEDIFNYNKISFYDAVASVGLVEHFKQEQMAELLLRHIQLANDNGTIFICVPAYSKRREVLVKTRQMKKKYGFQDTDAEFKIRSWLDSRNLKYSIFYLDKIGTDGFLALVFRYLNLVTYSIFRYNIDKHIRFNKGAYVLFIIQKTGNKVSNK
jgi:2-polyprenyl-3-methyl-5-hydroxy-6-metoxy-1,4-benzoquinol methylase